MAAAAPALTHHEILPLVEPFSRRGRHVDLQASDRAARRLAFKTVELPPADGLPALRETMTMDCRYEGRFVVQRILTHPGGLQATLEAVGETPGELLAAIEAVPREQHFRSGDGWLVARSYEFWSPRNATREVRTADALFLIRAVLQVEGLIVSLTQTMPRFRNVAADLALTPTGGSRLELPEDLLAVLGWDWARLVRKQDGWATKLRLRGNALRRSRTAEREVERAARHLAAKFGEPPAMFHERHRLARWGVVFRRGIPSITALAMVGGALALTTFSEHRNAGIYMALHYVPIAILALAFSLQELPQFEIPPIPRRSRAEHWREPADGPGS